MSCGVYASTVEKKLDEHKFCTYCNRQFYAIRRVYGHGQASAYRFSGKGKAVVNAEWDASEKLAITPSWHRCTFCGRYNDDDINRIKQDFPRYRRAQFEKIFGLVLGGGGLFFLGVFIACVIFTANTSNVLMSFYISVFPFLLLSFGVICWIQVWKIKPPRKVDPDDINDPERIKLWLSDWRKKSGKLVAMVNSDFLSEEAWKSLSQLQNEWDFRPKGSAPELVSMIFVIIIAFVLSLTAVFSYNGAVANCKADFNKFITSGKKCFDDKDWVSARKAFIEAVRVYGYENDNAARNYIRKCEENIRLEETAIKNARTEAAPVSALEGLSSPELLASRISGREKIFPTRETIPVQLVLKRAESVKEAEQTKPGVVAQLHVKDETELKIEGYHRKIDEAKKILDSVVKQRAQAKIDYDMIVMKYALENDEFQKKTSNAKITNNVTPAIDSNLKAYKAEMDNKKKNYDALNTQFEKINGDILTYNRFISKYMEKNQTGRISKP